MGRLEINQYQGADMKPSRISLVLGKRGTGKTTTLMSLLYQTREHYDYGIVCSPTQSTLDEFRKGPMPDCLLYEAFDPSILARIIAQQKSRQRQNKKMYRIFLVLDDIGYDARLFQSRSIAMKETFFNARHLNLTVMFCLQHMIGTLPPALRSNVDYLFALRDSSIENQKKLHKEFFSSISQFSSFQTIFAECTRDYDSIVLDNTVAASGTIRDSVHWYKAQVDLPPWRLCKQWIWDMAARYSIPPNEQKVTEQVDPNETIDDVAKITT
jgi:hypothetical protein